MSRSILPLPLSILLLVMSAAPVFAQRGGAMRTLEEKDQKKAIEIQIASVVRDLGLDDSVRSQLKEAYEAGRKNFVKSVTDKMSEIKGDNSLLMNTVYQVQNQECEKFGAAVSKFLNEKQVKRVKETLGTFNLHWDSLAFESSKLDLEADVRAKVEDRILKYVVDYSPARDEGYQNGDLSFVLRSMVQHKDLMDADLKKIMPKGAFDLWAKNTELKFSNPKAS